jgi:hypothetical protein
MVIQQSAVRSLLVGVMALAVLALMSPPAVAGLWLLR